MMIGFLVVAGGGICAKLEVLTEANAELGYQQPGGFAWDSGGRTAASNRWTLISAELQGYPPGMRFAVVFLAGKLKRCSLLGEACGPKFAGCRLLWKPKAAQPLP